jgi:cytochrome c-type biogenesis protein CcmH
MLLWLAFALLTAAVLAVVLAPLARPPRAVEAAEAGALAVYRHQLDEIEAERARGLVAEADAAAARLEVSRRLLDSAADESAKAEASAKPPSTRLAPVMIAVVVLTPLLTLGLYLAHGSPGLPSYPLAGRAASPLEQARIDELIAKVEAQLRKHPEDGKGWDVIAPIYFKLGRFREAAGAYAAAARLEGESVRRLAGFAEASVLAADGIVGEEARRAYENILKLEPGRAEPRFWLALAKEQDGRLTAALADYKALLSDAPAGASWRAAVESRIAEVSRRLESGTGQAERRGPTPEDVAAAEKLAPADRAGMIEQMVAGLAERLKRDGRDLAGWLRLVNAYVVLGRKDEARAALAQARQHFPGDEQALAKLSALAQTLGLGS